MPRIRRPSAPLYRRAPTMSNASSISPTWRRCWLCCAPGRATLPGLEKHSHAGHLPDDIDFARVEDLRRRLRRRMRLNQQGIVVQRAPAASIAAAMLQEIDRPVQFIRPPAARDLAPVLIN